MNNADLLTTLHQLGAIVTDDHIVYTSGRHGSSYVNKDALYPHTAAASQVGAALAHHFADANVEIVAGPTIGGVIMAQWTAHHLSRLCEREILAVYAEEEQGETGKRRVFRRGYDTLIAGKRVLVVEDVLTTGGSARLVVEAVTAAGGMVVGVGALCNRGGITAADLGAPRLVALTELPLESYPPDNCPLCAAGIPINTRLGKGAAYARRPEAGSG
ncbi:phosphoribosyltransferase family protein [Chloroflexus sp.]|uniref:phosphoribosyltransferase family protein n=1 Tax=Chloroflexus sp. TaxID=1904827 RepID=UPI00263627FA|nr:phosphoribosyltransferase family protein [uncultured Chloroflexus sp.]